MYTRPTVPTQARGIPGKTTEGLFNAGMDVQVFLEFIGYFFFRRFMLPRNLFIV